MKKRKILLVDDDTSLLVTLADFLISEGYDVATAESGERAVAMLKRARPDLIVLDMSMPGIGGMGVLEVLTRPDGSTRFPVLVLTARAAMAEYFANKQVDGFLAKPCAPGDLALEVSRIIFQRSGSSRAVAAAPPPVVTVRRVLVGAGDADEGALLQHALTEAGFEVETVASGPDVIEAAVMARPDAIVLRLELAGMGADAVLRVLRQMRGTRGVPLVIYGIAQASAPLEQVVGLDELAARLVSGVGSAEVVQAVRAALAAD